MIDTLLAIIAPHQCVGCDLEGNLLCAGCSQTLAKIPERCYRCRKISKDFKTCRTCRNASKLSSLRPVTYHQGQAKQLVWHLKFDSARAATKQMVETMLPLLPETKNSRTVIAHVPTATSRVRRRGYDQSRLLARALAAGSGLPSASFLVRLGQHQQVGAARRVRLKQLERAYLVKNRRKLAGAHVILVDDVLTTGATLEAAAASLKAGGARKIDALVFTQA